MSKFDHHLHTSRYSPDSVIDPYELLDLVVERNLSGVVITEHDALWPAEEIAELQGRCPEIVVLSGVEVSAREGHFLVYGLPDLSEVAPGIRLGDLLRVVHAHEAAIVAAHPFRWEQDFLRIIADHGPVFHGIELVSNNVSTETRALTARLLKAQGTLRATGSSDAHQLSTVGCYFTEFEDTITTMAEFVKALKGGRFQPCHHKECVLASGPID